MLVNDTQIDGELLVVGRHVMKFSLAGEGTKVSMHSLGTLFVLIVQQLGDYGYFSDSEQFCSQGNLFSDFKSRIPEADIVPMQKGMTVADPWSNAAVVDNTGLSLPSDLAFNSLLASLSPQLTNAYLITHVARYRPGESRHAHNLCA